MYLPLRSHRSVRESPFSHSIRMSQLQALKAATTLTDVAHLLDIKPGMLSYVLYKMPKVALYSTFTIPKRLGGTREISAPSRELKLIQHRLALLLERCQAEINASLGHTEDASKSGIAHGFKKNHSILTNARPHVARRRVFNVDLHDFFGSINFGRVRGFFIANKHFALAPKVATILAQIACHENKLPQGSPCSPIISNLVGHTLDILLVQLAKATDCTYTRYADDLTFSSNKPTFSSRVARQPNPDVHEWEPGRGLQRALKRAGFSLNDKKTRMQYRDSRQIVTGLTVNRKPNVPATYRYKVRAMAHSLFTTGTFDFVEKTDDGMGGKIITKKPGTKAQLVGMLAYIDFVDSRNSQLCKENGLTPVDTPGRITLFRRVLYFDYFYSASAPLILCEGKTDNVYIKCAIKSLASNYPALATADTPPKLNVKLFKYVERRSHYVTEISGGVGGLCKLIKNYHDDVISTFKAPAPMHPVIILIDNDSGANSVFGAIAGITRKHRPTGKENFIHVTANLYVVPTPLMHGGSTSTIENFFDATTLSAKLNGKAFEPGKDADNATHYGKAAFARDVVARGAATINFSGFTGVLDRIVEAMSDYYSKHPSSAPTIAKPPKTIAPTQPAPQRQRGLVPT
jgi:RNA-directed DNA polymerase